MKTNSIFRSLCFALALLAGSCSKESDEDTIGGKDESNDYDSDFVSTPQPLDLDNMVSIAFTDSGIVVVNPFLDSGVNVEVAEGRVSVSSTITDRELSYVLSGEAANGAVKFYGEYKFNLYLNGVSITNSRGGAINIQCGKKISVYVVEGTDNRLVDAATYTQVEGEDMKGTLFSEGQLNFYGTGSLLVRGKNKHAICTDDYFRMYEGNITIKEAAGDAIHANDYIQVDGGTLSTRSVGEGLDCEKGYVAIKGGAISIITTGDKGHGVKSATTTEVSSSGSITIVVEGKASKGFNSAGDMSVSAGSVSITTTGDAFYDESDREISSASGIKCAGNLTVSGGSLTIASSGSGGKGISVDNALTVNGGTLSISTTGGLFTYGNDDTSPKGIKCDGNLTVNGGNITIKTSGSNGEGMESKDTLRITGGSIEIDANDDGMNASRHIDISGGYIFSNSATNDGMDSNGTISVSGGVAVMAGTTAPEEGVDCDQNRFAITGGVLLGLGGATSSPTANACTQRSLIYNSSGAGIQVIRIESTATGTEALTLRLPRTYSSQMCLLFSSPSLAANTGYTIYTGGSIAGGTDFHGLCTDATYTKGSSATTFTTSSMVTTVGASGGPGGNQGGPGRP